MRAHVIEGGKVANTIEVESLDILTGLIDASLGGTIGDLWDGHVFTKPPAPPPVVPASVTRFQALAALHLAGKLEAVQAMMSNPATPVMAKLAFDNALVFERTSPTVEGMAQMLSMTSADIDALFIAAGQITA